MLRTRVIHCVCCGLEQPVSVDDLDVRPVLSCPRCAEHRCDTLDSYATREADHARMYRHALVDAQDDVLLAHGERDFYRDRMKAAYGSRELLVQALAQIEHVHHARGKRCSCGKHDCKVLRVLGDPRVGRLVRTYDEERRTLRELRNANPEAWTERWDYIDVSLVYPRGERRSGPGRHRATG